jgi:hypothetical protein
LLPHLAGVVVEGAEVTGAVLCIWARSRADQAVCPGVWPALGAGA